MAIVVVGIFAAKYMDSKVKAVGAIMGGKAHFEEAPLILLGSKSNIECLG